MKVKNILKELRDKIKNTTIMVGTLMILLSPYVYADTFDNVTAEIAKWAIRLGGLLAFVGAITFGMAFQSEDAGGKRRGVLEFVGGLIVAGFAVGYKTIFGL